jgi:hypothetical protein
MLQDHTHSSTCILQHGTVSVVRPMAVASHVLGHHISYSRTTLLGSLGLELGLVLGNQLLPVGVVSII